MNGESVDVISFSEDITSEGLGVGGGLVGLGLRGLLGACGLLGGKAVVDIAGLKGL